MPAPEHVSTVRGDGRWKARNVTRRHFPRANHRLPSPVGFVLGPALAGLVTSVAWGGLARALGLNWGHALAVAGLTGAFAALCTVVMVAADTLGDSEAVRDARAGTHSELRRTACL
jgi:hypothetical protein